MNIVEYFFDNILNSIIDIFEELKDDATNLLNEYGGF